ncbi:MAG: hypothetical protein B7Z18_04240, partial [Alishewanella sp. 32-51-5]
MIPELGQLTLTFAFALSLLLGVVPLVGSFTANERALLVAKPLAVGNFVFTLLAFIALCWAFYHDDFTVINVAT